MLGRLQEHLADFLVSYRDARSRPIHDKIWGYDPAMRLVILVLVGVALGLPAAAAEGESGPYPIWWSPALELDSLDQLEARLHQSLWPSLPDNRSFTVLVTDNGGQREMRVRTCADISWLEGKRFTYKAGSYSPAYFDERRCRVLGRLNRAVPAQQSFVNDFVLNKAAVDVLPAMVEPGIVCEELCRQYKADKEGVSWRDYWTGWREELLRKQGVWTGWRTERLRKQGTVIEDEQADGKGYFFGFDEQSDHRMVVETFILVMDFEIRSLVDLEILARADFTGDGLEDLLMWTSGESGEGRLFGGDFILLTRDAVGEVLRVVEPERHICPDYQCD